MFFICWFPFHIQRLMTVFLNERTDEEKGLEKELITKIWTLTFYISGYCYYSNSACNPILYNILSEKYRIAFCRTILGERMANKILSFRGNNLKSSKNFSQRVPSRSSVKFGGSENLNVTTRLLPEDEEKHKKLNEFIDAEIS